MRKEHRWETDQELYGAKDDNGVEAKKIVGG